VASGLAVGEKRGWGAWIGESSGLCSGLGAKVSFAETGQFGAFLTVIKRILSKPFA
jgi:hypothetical protein